METDNNGEKDPSIRCLKDGERERKWTEEKMRVQWIDGVVNSNPKPSLRE